MRRFLERSTRSTIPYSVGIRTSSFTNLPMPTTTTTWVAAYTTTRNTIPQSSSRTIVTPLLGDSSAWRHEPLFRKNHELKRRHIWFLRGGAFDPDGATVAEEMASHHCDHSLPPLLNIYPVSVCSIQGYRNHMEDEFLVAPDLAAVFDGHGGESVSLYLKQNLYAHLQSTLPRVLLLNEKNPDMTANHAATTSDDTIIGKTSAPEASDVKVSSVEHGDRPLLLPTQPAVASVEHYVHALRLALDKVDQEVIQISHWSYQGSTAVVAWIHQESTAGTTTSTSILEGQQPAATTPTSSSTRDIENSPETATLAATTTSQQHKRTLIVANIGDSRAILSRGEEVVVLTRDQKPNDPIEHARIINAGGRVTFHSLVSDDVDSVEEEDGYLSWDSYSESRIPGIFRVNGNLALARAVGDRAERP